MESGDILEGKQKWIPLVEPLWPGCGISPRSPAWSTCWLQAEPTAPHLQPVGGCVCKGVCVHGKERCAQEAQVIILVSRVEVHPESTDGPTPAVSAALT